MEEIKVNDYIRTTQGTITRIENTEFDICYNTFNQLLYKNWIMSECFYEEIVKHSSNIIDLIEVGDYVNGSEVVAEKYKNYDMNFINVDSKISFGWGYGVIPENDIKSIVTKEKFEKESYRLEE